MFSTYENAVEKVETATKRRFTRQSRRLVETLEQDMEKFSQDYGRVIASFIAADWSDVDEAFLEAQAHFLKQEREFLVAQFPRLF